MNIAIIQPYFFPYLGYWQLMSYVDTWVFFDNTQFNKRSWMTRNRILHSNPEKEFQFINLKTNKAPFGESIANIRVSSDYGWKEKIIAQLDIYRKLKAPYFYEVKELIAEILFSNKHFISQQAEYMAVQIMNYLGREVHMIHSNEVFFNLDNIQNSDDWALEIAKTLDATAYINPYGGVEIFDEKKYLSAGIELCFMKPKLLPYNQSRKQFIEGLSIIDVLMFNSISDVNLMLDNDYELDKKHGLISLGVKTG